MMRMEFRNGQLRPKTGHDFLTRIILAHLRGLSPEEFADRELARMQAARGEQPGRDPPPEPL